MYQCRMILQVHCAVQGSVATGMRTRNRLVVRMVAEVLALEVLLEIAATSESLQAIRCRQLFIAEAEDALGSFAFDGKGF